MNEPSLPDSNSCEHHTTARGICTNCGMCLEESEFYTATPMPARLAFRERPMINKVMMKHQVKDITKINDSAIRRILIPLNLQCHMNTLRQLLHTIEFKYKLKPEDKAIVAIYHILKSTEFPIATCDLLKYTNMSKFRMLKIHRDTFGYTHKSTGYLSNIYERAMAFFKDKGIEITGSFGRFCELAEDFRCSDPKSLCLAYLIDHNKIPNKMTEQIEELRAYQVKHIRRRFKAYQKLKT